MDMEGDDIEEDLKDVEEGLTRGKLATVAR